MEEIEKKKNTECPYCKKDAPRVTGRFIFRDKETHLHDTEFYYCQPCGAWGVVSLVDLELARLADSTSRDLRSELFVRLRELSAMRKAYHNQVFEELAKAMDFRNLTEFNPNLLNNEDAKRAVEILRTWQIEEAGKARRGQ